MRNYLSEAFREEDEAADRMEADLAISDLQEHFDQIIDNLLFITN
jgi:hypothetical protein